MESPCHRCEERQMRCHSYCERYKTYRQQQEAAYEKRHEVADLQDFLIKNRRDTADKRKKRRDW